MYRNLESYTWLAALGLALAVAPAAALDSDRHQPLELSADVAEMNNKTGVGVYTGDVVLEQGTMRITGDKMTVYTTPEGSLSKAVVEGQQATYRQLPEGQEEYVNARAPRMEYRAVEPSEVVLTGGAVLTQGKNEFKGELIRYEVAADLVTAKGEAKERVKITFFPNDKKEAKQQ